MKLVQATVFSLAAALGVAQFAGCASSPDHRSTGAFVDDAALTAKVKTALAQDRDAPAMDVNVQTYDGIVQLSGFVQDDNQVRRAGQVARAVDGVREVHNNLRVEPRR
jgi:hyperosmotically inducible protein